MKREDAIAIVDGCVAPDTVKIVCNGHISRALHAANDKPTNFYMIGSMGLAPAIALGLSVARPDRRVAVFDGDGNVLMGLGTLASVGARRPAAFAHFCFDNGTHASTGGQRTVSDRVDLAEIARAAGYVWSRRTDDEQELARLAAEALAQDGPSFLLVKVDAGGLPEGTGRVAPTPTEMTARLRGALAR